MLSIFKLLTAALNLDPERISRALSSPTTSHIINLLP